MKDHETVDVFSLRHHKKQSLSLDPNDPTGGRDYAGSPQDISFGLTNEGIEGSKINGKLLLPGADLYIVSSSGMRRAVETLHYMLGSLNIKTEVAKDGDKFILGSNDDRVMILKTQENQGIDGYTWEHELIPQVTKDFVAEKYIKNFIENAYFANGIHNEKPLPSVPMLVYAQLSNIKQLAESSLDKALSDKVKVKALNLGHDPFVSLTGNILSSAFAADTISKNVYLEEGMLIKPFSYGEGISAKCWRNGQDHYDFKVRENDVKYTTSSLDRLMNTLKEHTRL